MSPEARVRYWQIGSLLGAFVVVLGLVERDALLVVVGAVGTFVAVGMRAHWKQRIRDGDL